MAVLEQLEPRDVFHWFEVISGIPRGSRNTDQISAFCVKFAEERGLNAYRDAADNVIITAPASPGYEDAETVILQGHLDMVCEKDPDCTLDMERQGLELRTDGNWVWADGTTLGGDDGIAVAMILAILDNPSLPRPRIEALLTADEEIGLLGAQVIDPSRLKGRRLINLDSEKEGVLTVSCAGGRTVCGTLPVRRAPAAGTVLRIAVSGLTGGHSGTAIQYGRANADKVLGRILRELSRYGRFRLVSVSGGLKDNAIPSAAAADIVTENPDAVMHTLFDVVTRLKEAYEDTDPGFVTDVTETDAAGEAMDAESTARVIRLLTDTPDGVQAMSAEIPDLVQTSLNLGILKTEGDAVTAVFSVRSSVEAEKEALADRIAEQVRALGGSAVYEGDYPGWAYRPDSPLRQLCVDVYRDLYGREPEVEAVHAGLECGILCGKLPGLDCLSIGPDIPGIHSPREKLSVPSAARVWAYLLNVLERAR